MSRAPGSNADDGRGDQPRSRRPDRPAPPRDRGRTDPRGRSDPPAPPRPGRGQGRSSRPGDRGEGRSYPAVTLRKDLADAIRGGHPWLFAHALAVPADLPTGRVVDVLDRRERFLARGVYDADSPIGVRVWTLDPGEAIDAGLVARRVASAAALRRGVVDGATTDAFRLLHGEGDFLPGIVCDVYADTAVLQLDTAVVEPWLGDVARALQDAVDGLGRVVVRRRRRRGKRDRSERGERDGGERGRGRRDDPGSIDDRTRGDDLDRELPDDVAVLSGPPIDGPLVVREHGLQFEVDLLRGHKTGLYLDQRENRRRIGELAAGRTVLNLFAYTGGFSVAAAVGGAAGVTTVDVAAPVVEAAKRNFGLNGLDPADDRYRFHAADAFDFLDSCRDDFGIVVVDPPSMAPSKASLDRALGAYRHVNALAMGRVAPGGWLLTCSCSSHVMADDLRAIVGNAAAAAGRRVRIVEQRGAGPDHPTLTGFPEGEYLHALLVYVD